LFLFDIVAQEAFSVNREKFWDFSINREVYDAVFVREKDGA